MKKILVLLTMFILSLTIISCTNEEVSKDVYVTVYPLQYVTEQIFKGTNYSVGIVPGVTSHETSVDWSPKEIIAMTEATYLFYVGANYDQYIDHQISSIFTNTDVELVKIQDHPEYLELIQGVIHTYSDGKDVIDDHSLGLDPHFWISPLKIKQVAKLIYDYLILKFADPDGIMKNNFDTLNTNLQDLSDAFQEVINNAQKPAMTSTNIFGYLREDYGFDYISISPGYHEETEQFTSQDKDEIVNRALENNIKYIIYQMYTSSPLSNAVFNELISKGQDPVKLEFNILQSLKDEDINQGKNYISVMYNNLELLRTALDSQVE